MWIVLSASAGAMLGFELNDIFAANTLDLLHTWKLTLQKSSHGHTNLFGILHIAFGLTCAHSACSLRIKTFQTLGIFLGAFAMGPVMLIRSLSSPSTDFDATSLLLSVFLCASLAALLTHALGIGIKIAQK